jgi:hypothetical protein
MRSPRARHTVAMWIVNVGPTAMRRRITYVSVNACASPVQTKSANEIVR